MSLRTFVGHVSTLALTALVVIIVIGSVLGQPLLLSFVETGSMEPGLSPGDGFIVIPEAVAGPIGVGDVVIFDAERLHDGGLVTHRVVESSESGFVTKGDANTFVDQNSGEPLVQRAQVIGVALQYDGEVIRIPHLGTVVSGIVGVLSSIQSGLAGLFGTNALLGTQGLAYLFFGVSVLWYLLGVWQQQDTKTRQRDNKRSTGLDARLILAGLVVVLVVGTTFGMVGLSGGEKFEIISAEYDADGARIIPMGETETTVFQMGNGGLVPMVAFLEPGSQGIDVAPTTVYLEGRSGANATVTLSAPPQTGYYTRYLVVYRYFALLPQPHLVALYEFHPWAPIVVIDALVAIPFYILGVKLLGSGYVRSRTRPQDLSLPTQVRRSLNRLK